jgi:ethanolaminephosphotransferase
MLLATRIIRSWNQTGQKFAGEPDIVKTFLHTNPVLLWCLIGATYFWVNQNLIYGVNGLPVWLSFAVATGLVLAAFTFKVAFTLEDAPELVTEFARRLLDLNFTQGASLVTRARAVFMGVALLAGLIVLFILARRRISLTQSGVATLATVYTLLALTQSRPTNIPLYLLFNLQYRILSSVQLDFLSPVEVSTTCLLLQHASFFASGGSNSIASVDLSSAYNGIASFDVAAVGVLTFVGNWAAPIWWSLASVVLLVRKKRRREIATAVADKKNEEREDDNLWKSHVAVLTVFVAGSVAAVMAACTLLRTHLFIWTVFSPKYLYCVAWTLGQHMVVNVGLCGLVYWLGTVEQRGEEMSVRGG